MKTFGQWVENQFLYRIDKDQIQDFSKDIKSYHHTPDWSQSGTFEENPPNLEKTIGLFAGDLKNVVPYAVPRAVISFVPDARLYGRTCGEDHLHRSSPYR